MCVCMCVNVFVCVCVCMCVCECECVCVCVCVLCVHDLDKHRLYSTSQRSPLRKTRCCTMLHISCTGLVYLNTCILILSSTIKTWAYGKVLTHARVVNTSLCQTILTLGACVHG